jgi:glycosyltransferase involved in cell wall biosynthesis
MGMKHIAVVAGYEWIFVSPSTVGAVEMLAEHGYHVDLLARQQLKRFPGTGIHHPKVSTYFYPWDDAQWNVNLQNLLFSAWVIVCCLRLNPPLFLAIDPEALVACSLFATLARRPVIYFSLEIATWTPYPPPAGNPLRSIRRTMGVVARNAWKWAETVAHQRAILTIIQEPNRAQILKRENRLQKMEVVYVPPSLRTSYRSEARSQYLLERFHLHSDQVILLIAGGIADYYLLHELAQKAYSWPEEWVLVIHGPFREDDPYHAKLLHLCDGRKVIASSEMLPQDLFDTLVASAHIGLAFYKDIGPNHFHITSGKLMQYLRCGLPVIAVDLPNMKDIVEKYGCGICVKDEDGVVTAVGKIMEDYQRYSHRAKSVFDELFRFDQHFANVIGKMDAYFPSDRTPG